jgi:hypothetical protein
MVNDRAQIYTIEGITAGVIMLVTAYLVLSTTTVFTPGDVHITDMQLEQTGNDALAMLDTPDNFNISEVRPNITTLSYFIQQNQTEMFGIAFNNSVNSRSGSASPDKIQFDASVFYRNSTLTEPNQIQSYHFNRSAMMTGRENSIRVIRLVIVNNTDHTNTKLEARRQAVLLEVLLWRG